MHNCQSIDKSLYIKGSAHFLSDRRLYEESVRVSRYYIVEGREDEVDSAASSSALNREMCKRTENGATHVVTGIKWGFNAFMTFE